MVDRSPRWKRTLKANHQRLRTEICIRSVQAGFHDFLTDVEYVCVTGSEKANNVEQVDKLLEILLTKEKWHFEEFLVSLRKHGYADTAARLGEEAGQHSME